MSDYLKNAINKIYGEDDDFILLGLTGRTGSGCSTAARILTDKFSDLNATLFEGNFPPDNESRKQRIIRRIASRIWVPFSVLQVRSIITLCLAEKDISTACEYIIQHSDADSPSRDEITKVLNDIIWLRDEAKTNDSLEKFYSIDLPSLSERLKHILKESGTVKLYQQIGANIRKSGDPIDGTIIDGAFYYLAEKINNIIQEIRSENKRKNKQTYIVIDAIRNPLEAFFFQDRYANFFLVAISCTDEERKKRLTNLKYQTSDIEVLDATENVGQKVKSTKYYYVQDIPSCLERADIYINNPDDASEIQSYSILTNQLIRFVTLMRRPGMITPTSIERTMQIAYTAKLSSGCISRQVGAVVTDENFSILSVGWNDTPYGQPPCNLRDRFDYKKGFDLMAYSDYEKNDQEFIAHMNSKASRFTSVLELNRSVPFCFKSEYNQMKCKDNQVHTRALHAEENAFLQITKFGGRGANRGFLFTTASPCELCSKKAYQLGVRKIYYIDPYPGIAEPHILRCGNSTPELEIFSGAIGRAYHKLYAPIVPYKDEIEAITSCDV